MTAIEGYGQPSEASSVARSYSIEWGDTLTSIARDHGVTVAALLAANPQITNPDRIYAGDLLTIPAGTETGAGPSHVVRAGDTLTAIARQHGVTVADIVARNGIANPDLIHPGQVLEIPARSVAPGGIGQPAAPADPVDPPAVEPPPAGDVDYNRIAGVRGNPNVTPAFIAEVEAMAARLGTRPEYLLATMSFETGGTYSPSIRNPSSGATGLIQFLGSTAAGLGTSTAALASMSAIDQLAYVEKYFEPYAGRLDTLEGVYTAVLSGRPRPDPDSVLFSQGTLAYQLNSGLDFDRNGTITSGEATSAVAARLYGGVSEVQQRLVDLGYVPAAQRNGFADGIYGPNTAAAVAAFQTANGLTATGLLDDATGAALFALRTPTPVMPAPGMPLALSAAIPERVERPNLNITSPVFGEIVVTESFMEPGGPHGYKAERYAIFADNPGRIETLPAGRANVGIDYWAPDDTIRAWFSGTVLRVTPESASGGYGNVAVIQLDQRFVFEGREYTLNTHYAHADRFDVSAGDTITAGQSIGIQGTTGHSTGDHVDFQTWFVLDDGSKVHVSPNLLAGGGH